MSCCRCEAGKWLRVTLELVSECQSVPVGKDTVVNVQEFQMNGARFSAAELAKYRGQWVAFSADGRRIVASNEDLVALDSLLVAAGEDPEKIALERIECDDVCLGAAEHD